MIGVDGIKVEAISIVASDITIVENLEGGVNSKPMLINMNASIDSERDDSELVSVVITIKYTHPVEGLKEWVSVGVASELELPGQAEVDFWNVLDTLTILAAPQSDENFEIVIQVTTECYN